MWTRSQQIENANYWSDSRVINSMVVEDTFFVKGSRTEIDMNWVYEQWLENEEYDPEQEEKSYEQWLAKMNVDQNKKVRCTSKYEPCQDCNGAGRMVNPSIDCGGIPMQDFYEDPDFAEDYYSGTYDVTCSTCNGSGEQLLLEYDTENPLYNWCCQRLSDYYEAQYEYAREVAAERRWGC